MSDTNQKSTAKDVFLHLLMIIMLYVGVVAFIAMVLSIINIQFPDSLNYYRSGELAAIRGSISSLLVVWPVLILTSWMIGKNLKQNIWVRKWLLYLTLFVAALTAVIDLIVLINTFLDGEISMRFVLKVLVVLAVAGAVFAHYLWDLRRDPAQKTIRPKTTAIVTSAIILATIVGGFFIVGSPAEQRKVRLDQERVWDLQSIQSELLSYWQSTQVLPEALDELEDPLTGFVSPTDPDTEQAYEYTKIDELTFELCATFESDYESNEGASGAPRIKSVFDETSFANWTHGAERTCFAREINPDLFDDEPVR